ncbi:hypothetical protein [Arthrobacter sp. HLT1-20]
MPTPPNFTDRSPSRHGVQNASVFIIAISCFVGGIYAFSFVQQYTMAAVAGGLILIALSFFLPMQLMALFDRGAPVDPGTTTHEVPTDRK